LDSTLVINIDDGENLEVPPEVGELRLTLKASGGLRDESGTSLASDSISPVLEGTFGTFIDVTPVTDGGSAFTTLPAGTTSELSLSAGVSGIITTLRVDESEVSDSLPSTEGETVTVDFAGDVIDIEPSAGAECTVADPCLVSFTFSQDDFDAILAEVEAEIAALTAAGETVTVISIPETPFDVKIFHDKNNDSDFNDPGEVLDDTTSTPTTVTEIISGLLFKAEADIDDTSKFAVGGVKALAIGALASSILGGGEGDSGGAGGFGDTTVSGESSGAGGFGGIIAELDLSDPNAVTILHPEDRLILRTDLYENQGINNIQHVSLYFGQGTPEELLKSKTYIMFDKDKSVHVSDPNGYFTDNVKFNILERDAYNFVVKYDIEFASTMPKSDMLLYAYDGDRNISKKFFDDKIVVLPTNPIVPEWVKNNAGWWSDGQISQTEFIQAIEFLSKQGIINIPPGPIDETGETAQSVPDWIKSTAEWWSDDFITEDEFVAAIQWLATKGIITL